MNSDLNCWLCLKQDGWSAPLQISVGDFSLPTKILNLLGIELKKDDSVPQVICHLCLAKIAFLDEFITQVKTSTTLLKSSTTAKDINCQVLNSREVADGNKSASFGIPVINCSLATINQKEQVDVNTLTDDQSLTDVPFVNDNVTRSRVNVVGSKSLSKNSLLKCTRCRFSTTSETLYKTHIECLYNCSSCSASFCTLKGMKLHYSKMHDSQKRKLSKNIEDNLDNHNNSNEDNNFASCGKSNDESDDNYDSHNKAIIREMSGNSDSHNNGYKIQNSQISNIDSSEQTEVDENRTMKWCKLCDRVFMSEKYFTEHECHSSSNLDFEKPAAFECSLPSNMEIEEPVEVKKRGRKRMIDTSVTSSYKPSSSVIGSSMSSNSNENIPSTTAKEDSASQYELKLKRESSESTDVFPCWKCKGEYESREKLFVHKCIASDDNNCEKQIECYDISDNSSDSDSSIKARAKSKNNKRLNLSSDSTSDKNKSEEEFPTNRNRKSSYDQLVIDLSDNDDHNNGSTKMLDNNSRQPHSFGLIASVCTMSGCTVMCNDRNTQNNNVNTSDSVLLKKCNECGHEFTTMKELVHHKRIHKI